MRRTTLAIASTLAISGVAATSAGALTLPKWLQHDQSAAASAVAPTVKAPAAIAPLQGPSIPNYRAIVENYGPAVVGVTVSGLRSVGSDDDSDAPSFDNDPFFRFFRGVPGLRMPPQGRVPFRGQGS